MVRPVGMPLKEFGIMRQTIQARVINALRLWVELSVDFKGMASAVASAVCVAVVTRPRPLPQITPRCRTQCCISS